MDTNNEKREATRSLRDLYPELSEDELREAAENYRRYAALLVRMYTRFQISGDDEGWRTSLTAGRSDAIKETVSDDERSSS